MTRREKCEQHRSCKESKWASTEQLCVWGEGQEAKWSTWSMCVRRVEWPKICWLGGARSPGLYWKLCHLIVHLPWAVTSPWYFSLKNSLQSMLNIKAGLPRIIHQHYSWCILLKELHGHHLFMHLAFLLKESRDAIL